MMRRSTSSRRSIVSTRRRRPPFPCSRPRTVRGRAGRRRNACSNGRSQKRVQIGPQSALSCKVVMTATHRGQPTMSRVFGGMLAVAAPTGQRVEVLHFHSFRIADGEIAEHAAVRDDLEMMFQLGLVQRPG